MKNIINTIRNLKQKIENFWRYYFYVKCSNETLEVYSKVLLWSKKRCNVSFDSIKAIYAVDSEFSFSLEVFLKDNKRLYLRRSLFTNDCGCVENWDELIKILAEKCLNFNMNNLEQAEETYELPFLCWHSEIEVPNIQVITTKDDISVVWQETGKEYSPDEYLIMSKNRKDI